MYLSSHAVLKSPETSTILECYFDHIVEFLSFFKLAGISSWHCLGELLTALLLPSSVGRQKAQWFWSGSWRMVMIHIYHCVSHFIPLIKKMISSGKITELKSFLVHYLFTPSYYSIVYCREIKLFLGQNWAKDKLWNQTFLLTWKERTIKADTIFA